MHIRVIKNRSDYEAALELFSDLLERDLLPGSKEEDALELLLLVIRDYEQKVIEPIEGDAIEAIRFRMDQMGMERKELALYLGSLSKVSEILSRKRSLSLSMIRKLHEGLGIPLESLVQKSPVKRASRSRAVKQTQKIHSLRRKKRVMR